MSDFLAHLGILFVCLPLVGAVLTLFRIPRNSSDFVRRWGTVFKNTLGVALLGSVTAQLTSDHMARMPRSNWVESYPWIAGLIFFEIVIAVVAMYRGELVKEASKLCKEPDIIPLIMPELKYYAIPTIISIPLFVISLKIPAANFPYLYIGFERFLKWLFNLSYIGSGIAILGTVCGALFFLGCAIDLLLRFVRLMSISKNR